MDNFNRESDGLNMERTGNGMDTGNGTQTVNPADAAGIENRRQENRSGEYAFWAEEASHAPNNAGGSLTQAPGYEFNEDGTYRYRANSQNSNSYYETGAYNGNTGYQTGNNGEQPNQRSKKHIFGNQAGGQKPPKNGQGNSQGKKAAKLIASAAVFGLVAGVVFQGVNVFTGTYITKNSGARVESSANSGKIGATTVSSGMTTTTDVSEVVENAMPSIVSIASTMTQEFEYFGQRLSQDSDASGSGFIVGKDDTNLYIATNNHMVDGAKAIAITFIDDSVLEATVKGTDTTSDLAIVAVPLKNISEETMSKIKVATLGSSESVKVGQTAIAIGNALGYGQSVTVGYISAKDRIINSSSDSLASQLALLQTDAAINPGNSGGALLNINGEVIGINDAKFADAEVEGMGYAIPISDAIPIINELMNREDLTENEKGYLGISGKDITADNNYYNMPSGVYVAEIAEGGAADKGGIKQGDIIVKINGAAATTMTTVQEKVNNIKAGTEITVTVMRSSDGEYSEMELAITLQDKSSLEKLQSSTNNSNTGKNGNFGYSNGSEDQYPIDGGQDESGQNANDIFQDFLDNFNQTN